MSTFRYHATDTDPGQDVTYAVVSGEGEDNETGLGVVSRSGRVWTARVSTRKSYETDSFTKRVDAATRLQEIHDVKAEAREARKVATDPVSTPVEETTAPAESEATTPEVTLPEAGPTLSGSVLAPSPYVQTSTAASNPVDVATTSHVTGAPTYGGTSATPEKKSAWERFKVWLKS